MGLTAAQEEDLKRITEGFIALTDHQQEGARHLPEHLWAYDQEDFIRAALGCFVELGELVNESQWKPWRSYGEPTEDERNKVIKEFGDVLHMLAWMLNNLRERFEIGPVDIAAGFMAAHLENIARFRGQVPGREPPPNIGVPRRPDTNLPDPKFHVTAGPRDAILTKVASTMEERREDMTPEELEALDRFNDYISGRDPAAVKEWLERPVNREIFPAL